MKRALLLAAPAALALGLVACSGDDDDVPGTISPGTTTEDTASEGTASQDTTVDTDPEDTAGGLTLPSIPDFTLPSLPSDFTIPSLPDFAPLSVPGDATEMMKSMIDRIFPNLDEEQLQCLADALSGDLDLSQMQGVAEECNIDESDLQPGG